MTKREKLMYETTQHANEVQAEVICELKNKLMESVYLAKMVRDSGGVGPMHDLADTILQEK